MYTPIFCVKTNTELWLHRSHGAEPPPSPKWWRCELTALSHCFNLYFIAYNDTIHVYQPSFPRQELANKPDLILHPPVSSPMLEPAIDLADPHSITRLHVDYLGREEILLVTCDDGDVIGYRVPEIYRVVESRRDSMYDESNPDLEDRVRIFLHQNVGASAWGLAVHREARLIAISANTHQVTVLALALSKPPTDPDIPPALDSSLSSENDDQDFPHSRWRGTIIILHASANIPAVFFDNSGRDPAGRWLFSSSIDGANQLWDLHEVEQVRTFEDGAVTIHAAPSCIGLAPDRPTKIIKLGHCVSVKDPTIAPKLCRCPDESSVPHAAWAAMFVDPRSCHPCDSLDDACGPFGPNPPTAGPPSFWDITKSDLQYRTKRTGPFASYISQSGGQNDDGESDSSDGMSLSEAGGEETGDGDEGEEEGQQEETTDDNDNDEEDSNGNQAQSQEPQQTAVDTQQELDTLEGSAPQGNHQSPPQTQAPAGSESPPHPAANDLYDMFAGWESDDQNSDESGTDNSSLPEPGTALLTLMEPEIAAILPPAPEPHTSSNIKAPYCEVSTSPRFSGAPDNHRPCIVVTKEEIYLYQSLFDPTSDRLHPILYMRNPLFPPNDNFPSAFPIAAYHRHCYATQIPELGVFIVASPAGRVGIFRLTKVVVEDTGQPLYSFRLDHLLPSIGREGETVLLEEVWGRRLVGVAVGPVQGMLDQPEDEERKERSGERGGGRRWRLMMTFHDHTVYSYELRKPDEEAPGLGDLLV